MFRSDSKQSCSESLRRKGKAAVGRFAALGSDDRIQAPIDRLLDGSAHRSAGSATLSAYAGS